MLSLCLGYSQKQEVTLKHEMVLVPRPEEELCKQALRLARVATYLGLSGKMYMDIAEALLTNPREPVVLHDVAYLLHSASSRKELLFELGGFLASEEDRLKSLSRK